MVPRHSPCSHAHYRVGGGGHLPRSPAALQGGCTPVTLQAHVHELRSTWMPSSFMMVTRACFRPVYLDAMLAWPAWERAMGSSWTWNRILRTSRGPTTMRATAPASAPATASRAALRCCFCSGMHTILRDGRPAAPYTMASSLYAGCSLMPSMHGLPDVASNPTRAMAVDRFPGSAQCLMYRSDGYKTTLHDGLMRFFTSRGHTMSQQIATCLNYLRCV